MSAMDIIVACAVVIALLVIAGVENLREVVQDFWGSLGRAHAGVAPSAGELVERERMRSGVAFVEALALQLQEIRGLDEIEPDRRLA